MPIPAYINHNRWVADCPICNGAELASPESPFFRCANCGFEAGVQFPANRQGIEAVLAHRPHLLNRNWRPGESIADLRAENIGHGVPV